MENLRLYEECVTNVKFTLMKKGQGSTLGLFLQRGFNF